MRQICMIWGKLRLSLAQTWASTPSRSAIPHSLPPAAAVRRGGHGQLAPAPPLPQNRPGSTTSNFPLDFPWLLWYLSLPAALHSSDSSDPAEAEPYMRRGGAILELLAFLGRGGQIGTSLRLTAQSRGRACE